MIDFLQIFGGAMNDYIRGVCNDTYASQTRVQYKSDFKNDRVR